MSWIWASMMRMLFLSHLHGAQTGTALLASQSPARQQRLRRRF
jgi:hypothetical protein